MAFTLKTLISGQFRHTQTGQSLLPLLYVQFIGALGFSLALPFLVYLVKRFSGGDNPVIYGTLGATYAFFQFVGAPLLGRLSDRVGRKKALFWSHFGTFFSWGLFLLALFLPITEMTRLGESAILTVPLLLLFFARALDGLTGGNISVANAYLADVTTETHRKANFGMMGAAMNLGFILGPVLAGQLGGTAYGEKLPVLAALVITGLGVLLIQYNLPESKPCTVEREVEEPSASQVFGKEHTDCVEGENQHTYSTAEVLRMPGVGLMVVMYFLIFLSFNLFYASLPVHAASETGLNWTVTQLGLFFSLLSGLMIGVQTLLLGYLSSRTSDELLVVVGAGLMIGFFSLMPNPNPMVIYWATPLFALGNGLMWPSFSSMLSRTGPPAAQGSVQGIAGSAGSLASIVGLLLGGASYDWLQARVFLLAAAVMVVVLVSFLLMMLRPGQAPQQLVPKKA